MREVLFSFPVLCQYFMIFFYMHSVALRHLAELETRTFHLDAAFSIIFLYAQHV